MKRAKNELLQFLGGLAMLVVGLFLFSQKVMVTSSFFGGMLWISGLHIANGMVMIPFIIGIVWMFASGGSFASKVFTGLGVLLIIATIILSTNISLVRITLYEWVLMLTLIFGGAGLLARILLSVPKRDVETGNRELLDVQRQADMIEREIEQLKREK